MRSKLDDRLACADPARGLASKVPTEVWSQLADSIMATTPAKAVAAEHQAAPFRAPRIPALARLRGVRRAAAILVAVCALLVAPVAFDAANRPGGASAAAAEVLDQAAINATDPSTSSAQYWKITTQTRDSASSATGAQTSVVINYVAVDGNRPTYTIWPPNGTRAVPTAQTTNLAPNDLRGGWQTPNMGFLNQLPKNVADLRARLYHDAQDHGPSIDAEVVVYVADALRSGIVPSDLRAALYQVLKTVPGVEVTAQAVSLGGRTGIAIARPEPLNGERQELIIDPSSGDLIGERTVAVDANQQVRTGSVITETSVTRSLVDEIPPTTVQGAQRSECSVSSDGAVTCSSNKQQP